MQRLRRLVPTILVIVSLALLGCDNGSQNTAKNQAQDPSTDRAGAMLADGGGPMSSGDVTAPAHVMPVKDAEAAYNKAKKGFEAAKNDDKAKQEYVKATNDFADAYMWGDQPKNVKYRKALKYYREVLKTDSGNEHAKSSADTIVSIYESLGRPVPKEGE